MADVKKNREILLNLLHDAQEREGYLSMDTLKRISDEQGIPLARLWGVSQFYTHFHTEPQGRHIIYICGSPSCVLNGATPLSELLEKELGIKMGQTSADGQFTAYKTSCLGRCDGSPAMLLDGQPYTQLTPERLRTILDTVRARDAKTDETRRAAKHSESPDDSATDAGSKTTARARKTTTGTKKTTTRTRPASGRTGATGRAHKGGRA